MAQPFTTIVSGLPRSGTSMMMQMLAAGGMDILTDKIREAGDDNPRGYFEFEPVKKTKNDATWLAEAEGKVVKVIFRLLYDLPDSHNYRVIFMRRHMTEVLESQKKMLERRGEPGASASTETLSELFDRQLEKIDRWIGEKPNFSVLNVEHKDVLTDPLGQSQQICTFLEQKLDAEAMASVVDPDLYRNRASR